MNTKKINKLTLNKETVRQLTDTELGSVAGGQKNKVRRPRRSFVPKHCGLGSTIWTKSCNLCCVVGQNPTSPQGPVRL